jgi:hypothetical protein
MDLPPRLNEEVTVFIEFMQCATKPGEQNTHIGWAALRILRQGRLVPDGLHCLAISYLREPSDGGDRGEPGNSITVRTRIDSAAAVHEGPLAAFFEEDGSIDPVLRDCADKVLSGFYRVLEQIVSSIESNAKRAIESLAKFAQSLLPYFGPQISNHLVAFVQVFTLPQRRDFHVSLLDAWAVIIRKAPPETRPDELILDALWILVLKSNMATRDPRFASSLMPLLQAYAEREANTPCDRAIEGYARFVLLLFDAGYYAHAVKAIVLQSNAYFAAKNPAIQVFLELVLTPKLFYISIITISEMQSFLQNLLLHARSDFQSLFSVLLRLFYRIPKPVLIKIVHETRFVFKTLSPLSSIPMQHQFPPHIFLFAAYIDALGTSDEISDWWLTEADKLSIFASFHYMINRTTISPGDPPARKEQCTSIHLIILRFLREIFVDVSVTADLSLLLYRILWTDFFAGEYVPIIDLLCDLVRADATFVFEHCVPALPKLLLRVFWHSTRSFYVSNFFISLFEADSARHGSTDRAFALCCRALSLLPPAELAAVHIRQSPALAQLFTVVNSLKSLERDIRLNLSLNDEETIFLRKRRLLALRASPDATIGELLRLAEFHTERGYVEEAFQAHVLVLAIVTEYLTVQGRIPRVWGTLHPADLFTELCGESIAIARCPEDSYPVYPGICDSEHFDLRELISLIEAVPLAFSEGRATLEQALALLDLVWPLYEATRSFQMAGRYFKILRLSAMDLPPTADRVFGPYFRVAFFGNAFYDKNGRTFIYREKPLTHLYELAQRLVKEYETMLGVKVKLIKESGEIVGTNDGPAIQITFVEPYFRKQENDKRVTSYDISHNVQTFFFDAPFLKNSDRVHGGLEEQWIKRTMLTVEVAMPSVWKVGLVKTDGIVVREFPPIRVAFRMIRDRAAFLENALVAKDARKVQQLLHGSLLVMVNEGPAKIADVFLTKPGLDLKYEKKLAQQFVAFLNACFGALKFHGEWTRENIAFKALQDELEAGYVVIEEKVRSLVRLKRVAGKLELIENFD